MITRVRTDTGLSVIPNSAIASGIIMITKVQQREDAIPSHLPYAQGDRVITTYKQSEGTVTEITALLTKILLDSGEELTSLNSSVLAGLTAIAKTTQNTQQISKKRKIESD